MTDHLTVSKALDLIDDYHQRSEGELLEALTFIDDYRKHLTDEQRQRAFDACCRMTWADRFLVNMPHDRNNPGLVASELKSKLIVKDTDLTTFDLSLDAYLKRRNLL